MTKDMTQGSPLKLILAFAVPLMLGSLFQQFYNLADTIIVGRFVGVEALAAVGSVGGGIMEYRIQQLAGKMLAGAAAPAQLVDLTTDGTGDDAAIAACGGSMQVFLQRIEPEE